MAVASSEFWDFSLRIYALPGVSDECLALQERCGTNINLLLFCVFCGAKSGAKLSAEELAEASSLVSSWHADVTKSLRSARNSIKRLKPADASSPVANHAESLRQSIKQLELAAENIEHVMLEDWWHAKSAGAAASNPADAVRSNVALLLGHGEDVPVLVNAALAERT